MQFVSIRHQKTGALLATRAGWYSTTWNRFRGLMLRPSLPEGEGIVLVPCGSVHMFLMRFAIDIIYLDRDLRVVKLVRNLQPYRLSWGGRRAHATVELPAGTLTGLFLEAGDALTVEPQQVASLAAGDARPG